MPAARTRALLRAFSLSTGDACQISWIGHVALAQARLVAAAACTEICNHPDKDEERGRAQEREREGERLRSRCYPELFPPAN